MRKRFRRMIKQVCCTSVSAAMVFGISLGSIPVLADDLAAQSVVSDDVVGSAMEKEQEKKVRTIVTTDGEVDDQDTFIRFMLYLNELDVEGLVMSSSTYHYAGIPTAAYAQTAEYQEELVKGTTRAAAQAAEQADMDAAEAAGEDPESARHYSVYPYRWTGEQWMDDVLTAYGDVEDNLRANDQDYPTEEELRNITKIGNIENVGDFGDGRTTEGSDFIKNILLDNSDSDPIYIQTRGGTNTTAQALFDIEKEYKGTDQWNEIYQKVCAKTKLYIILNQDDSFNKYIKTNWPDIFVIHDGGTFWRFAYMWTSVDSNLTQKLRGAWFFKNIKKNHGALMSLYRSAGDGTILPGEEANEQRCSEELQSANGNGERYGFISEGDSPSFFYLLPTGLRSLENPANGGWGGRFGEQTTDGVTTYEDITSDFNPYSNAMDNTYGLTRWFDDIQDDFAARADWCVKSYSECNHYPTVSVKEGLDITAAPGERIVLNADASDPDGDDLNYTWWQYFESDTYSGVNDGKIALTGSATDRISFTVPEDAKNGENIHVICEVQDDSNAPLKKYARVIITVQGRQEISDMSMTVPEGTDLTNLEYTKTETVIHWGNNTFTRITEPTVQASVTATDADGNMITKGKTYTYTSSNDKVATVSSSGLITLKGLLGKATITATVNDGTGLSDSLDLIVTKSSAEQPIDVTFTDVQDPSQWFYSPVYWAVQKGITTGIDDTLFGVGEECTRGQVMTFLYKAAGSPDVFGIENPFTDVEAGEFYYDAVLWAANNGITGGTTATTFSPDDKCTRAQVATFLFKTAGSPEISTENNPFTDISEKDWFYSPVLWAYGNSVTNGTSENTFSPGNYCTRAQVITFIYHTNNT